MYLHFQLVHLGKFDSLLKLVLVQDTRQPVNQHVTHSMFIIRWLNYTTYLLLSHDTVSLYICLCILLLCQQDYTNHVNEINAPEILSFAENVLNKLHFHIHQITIVDSRNDQLKVFFLSAMYNMVIPNCINQGYFSQDNGSYNILCMHA